MPLTYGDSSTRTAAPLVLLPPRRVSSECGQRGARPPARTRARSLAGDRAPRSSETADGGILHCLPWQHSATCAPQRVAWKLRLAESPSPRARVGEPSDVDHREMPVRSRSAASRRRLAWALAGVVAHLELRVPRSHYVLRVSMLRISGSLRPPRPTPSRSIPRFAMDVDAHEQF